MGARMRWILSVALATMALAVAGGVTPQPAAAAIGDIISTIDLKKTPNGLDLCSPVNITNIGNNSTGSSVAIVQASKVGLFQPSFQPKLLLVTSCLGANSDTAARKATIYFVSPSTFVNPLTQATVTKGVPVQSIVTSFVPPRGWSAIALRSDKLDFIACAATGSNTGTLEIYKISFSGTATPLITGTAALKGPLCDGLAWDYDPNDPQNPNKKMIYASTGGGTTIRRWASASNNDQFTQVSPDLTTPTQVPLGGGAAQNCSISGLALVDGALFVACRALSSGGSLAATGHLINKSTGSTLAVGAVLSSFGTASGPLFDQTLTEDIECDAVTFGESLPYRDALWAKNRTTNVLNAFELPAYTCGRSLGPIDAANNPLVTLLPSTTPPFRGPGPCPAWFTGNKDGDADGDSLLDCWEDVAVWTSAGGCPSTSATCNGKPGIDWDGDGNRDVDLCVEGVCADKFRRDVFVEVDSMDLHPFDLTARQQVIDAFANAPLPAPSGGTTSGIALHVLLDDGNAPGSDTIPHATFVSLEPCTPAAGTGDATLDQVKKAYFGTKTERAKAEPQKSTTLFAKRLAFRWALLAHDLKPPALNPGAKSSGCAKLGGDDLVVTLGSIFAGSVVTAESNGNVNDLAGTFMHELGHTLWLRHGGNDNSNCKPNYLSVMSYSRQFSDGAPLAGRRLDYSRGALPQPTQLLVPLLDETGLNEATGLGTPVLPQGVTDQTVFGVDGSFVEPATTLTPSATTGNLVTFTASVPVFAPTDVGKILRGDGVAGEAVIRSYITATQVKADIKEAFGSISAIASGSWRLVTRVERIVPAGPNIDWNNDSLLGTVAVDVNNLAFPDSKVSGCDWSKGEQLVGWDDWSNLQYNHRASAEVAAGEVKDPADGLQAAFESVDVNGDGVPDARCQATGQLWVIDIQSPIKLAQTPGGDTQVKFFSQAGCIVAFLDPSTLTLTGSSGIKGPVKLKNSGQFNCSTPDLNNDGLPDLVCHFDDNGFVLSDVIGLVEGQTLPSAPNQFGFRARADVEVQ